MVDSKKLNASIKYGSENFIITITGMSLHDDNLSCFDFIQMSLQDSFIL